jgi:hypothetical protein
MKNGHKVWDRSIKIKTKNMDLDLNVQWKDRGLLMSKQKNESFFQFSIDQFEIPPDKIRPYVLNWINKYSLHNSKWRNSCCKFSNYCQYLSFKRRQERYFQSKKTRQRFKKIRTPQICKRNSRKWHWFGAGSKTSSRYYLFS